MDGVRSTSAAGGPGRFRLVSWPDWLLARVGAAPGPAWLAFLVILGLVVSLALVARSLSGVTLTETAILTAFIEVSYPIVFLASLGWLNRVAVGALETLGPALTIDPGEVDELRRELVRTPARWALVCALAGLLFSPVSIASGPEGYGLLEGVGPALWLWEYALTAMTFAVIFVVVAHTLHQLAVVARIHREMVRVDLFTLDPLYSFAGLTSWTGIVIFGGTVYAIGSLYLVAGVQFSAFDMATVVGLMLIATASFVVPLRGLHDRISAEKARHRALAGETLAATVAEVQARIRAGEYERMSPLSDALAAATSAAASIARISTWPWRPETLRGFASAVALPVLLWTITALLGRFI